MRPFPVHSYLVPLVMGGTGAAVAVALSMPMGFLAGPALAVAICGVCGARMEIAPWMRDGGFLVIGLSIGSLVHPDSLNAMLRWPVAFALLAALTVITPWLGQRLIPRFMPIDRHEAYLASAPGHLTLVIALAASTGLSLSRTAILASIRLLSLTLFVPLAARYFGVEIGVGLPKIAEQTPWLWLVAQAGLALVLMPVMGLCKIPAPAAMAGLFVGAAGHISGIVSGAMPLWMSQSALVLMGCLIGVRFSGLSWRELNQNLLAGGVIVGMACALAVAFALPAAYLSGLPLLDILLGFSPGGLETMTVLGAALGADPAFVAAAHLFRLLILAVVLTAYATQLGRPTSADT